MRQRFLIIHNHGAGSGRDDLLDDATTHLQTTGARVTRREAHGEAMGWRMAGEAGRSGEYDTIVAARRTCVSCCFASPVAALIAASLRRWMARVSAHSR